MELFRSKFGELRSRNAEVREIVPPLSWLKYSGGKSFVQCKIVSKTIWIFVIGVGQKSLCGMKLGVLLRTTL